jgi:hypothetical protein
MEVEYRHLMDFHEKLVGDLKLLVAVTYGAIILVITIAGAFLWKNTSEVRDEARAAIEATKQSASQEISAIGKNASDVASTEARKAIDAALERQNVHRLIEQTAQEKVGPAVEQQVQKDLGPKIEAFRILVTEIGEISNHGAQLRLGFRPGLDYLVKEMASSDPTVRAYARSTAVQIGSDYEQKITQFAVGQPNFDPVAGPLGLTEAAKTAKGLMGLIHMGDPYAVAAAFYDMKKLVAWDVQTFDVPAAEKWCAAHKPKCDQ